MKKILVGLIAISFMPSILGYHWIMSIDNQTDHIVKGQSTAAHLRNEINGVPQGGKEFFIPAKTKVKTWNFIIPVKPEKLIINDSVIDSQMSASGLAAIGRPTVYIYINSVLSNHENFATDGEWDLTILPTGALTITKAKPVEYTNNPWWPIPVE